jgi:hypothetical protein
MAVSLKENNWFSVMDPTPCHKYHSFILIQGGQIDPRHLRVHGGPPGHEVDPRRSHQDRSEAAPGRRDQVPML